MCKQRLLNFGDSYQLRFYQYQLRFSSILLEMDKNNPLNLNTSKVCVAAHNRSGRPTKKNIIRFGPQPKSYVSQLLRKLNAENGKAQVAETDLEPTENEVQTQDFINNEEIPEEDNSPILKKPNIRLLTHSKGENIYACDYPNCNYACKISSNLIKHKRTHSLEKPYLCDLCSFQTKFVNSLKAHKRTHTNEKPYCCTYCDYRCNSSSNLKKHCKHMHS